MILEVKTTKELKQFIYYIKELYKDDPYYVYPIFSAQKKELAEIVLHKKTYKALLCEQGGQVKGRLLFTYDYSKKQGKKICYFSYFDAHNSYGVVQELFAAMEEDMKTHNVDYSEGTFSPFDPDTRRGVMVKGFKSDPSIFTSYNYEYYGELLEQYGYRKAIDTVLLNADVNKKSKKRLNTFSKFFKRSHDVRIDSLDWNQLDRDLQDIEIVIREASNEIVYQDAPSIDMIRNVAQQMKFFINPKFVKIARENETDKPVGFCLVVPDFNQVFKKTKGKIRPLRMIRLKKQITRARGQMQYIVPEYQNTGLIGHIFNQVYDDFIEAGITDFEGGTMMEDNHKPITAFKKFGGEITKIYRIYGKEV